MRAETVLGMPVRAERWGAIVTIQPEQAEKLLESQPSQRPVDERHVQVLSRDISAGKFTLTHQGIAFDESGLLFDGQHRLWACFTAGRAIRVWVFFNEPRSNFDVVDTRSKPRTPAQLAVVKGQFHRIGLATAASTAARFLFTYDRGLNPTHPHTGLVFGSRDMDATMAQHPLLAGAVERFVDSKALRRVGLTLGPTIALFMMFEEADPARAAVFIHQVLTGQNLSEGHPALSLRNALQNAKPSKAGRAVDATYRTARAWNHLCAGRSVSVLYGAVTPRTQQLHGDRRDPFPEIAGYVRPGAR